MRSFLALTAGPSGSLPSLERCEQAARRALAFRDMSFASDCWTSESGRSRLIAWSNTDADDPGEQTSILTRDGHHALAIDSALTGLGALREADVLRDLRRDARGCVDSLAGVFALGFANGQRDEILCRNGAVKLRNIFFAQTPQFTVAGDRALLVHLIATGRNTPDYDLEQFAPYLTAGWFASDGTPYRGVSVLPPMSALTLSTRGPSVSDVGRADIFPRESESISGSAAYDELADAFLRAIEPLKHARAPISIGVTGGKDSRIIAAGLKAAGVNCSAFTSGHADHPDVILARRIAEVLGWEHLNDQGDRTNSQPFETHPYMGACRDLFMSDGLLGGWAAMPQGPTFDPSVIIRGAGGEVYRGGYLKVLDNPLDVSHDRLQDVLHHNFLRGGELLESNILRRYQHYLRDWTEQALQGRTPREAAELCYLQLCTGRWAAPSYSAKSSRHWRIAPYCDNRLFRVAARMRSRDRIQERVQFEIVRRLAPALADLPIFPRRWAFEVDGPDQGDRAGWKRRHTLEHESHAARCNWKDNAGLALRDEFREVIFHGAGSEPLFQILNRDRFTEFFESRQVLSRHGVKCLWNAYSAATLLSNDWLSATPPDRAVPIPAGRRVRWNQVVRRTLNRFEASVARQQPPEASGNGATPWRRARRTARSRRDLRRMLGKLNQRVAQNRKLYDMPDDLGRAWSRSVMLFGSIPLASLLNRPDEQALEQLHEVLEKRDGSAPHALLEELERAMLAADTYAHTAAAQRRPEVDKVSR